MSTDAVYNFLKIQNRPYSSNDVCQNFGKEYGKSEIHKTLDMLVKKKMIMDKTYGKQKVYCVAQDDADLNSTSDGLKEMVKKIHELTTNMDVLEAELIKNSSELKGLQTKKTLAEATSERDILKQEVCKLQEKLKNFKENSKPISAEEKLKVTSEHEKCLKEYRKRKRICADITNAILEGYPKTKKHLFEDIGIETDEDVGFKLLL